MKKIFVTQYVNKRSVNDALSYEYEATYCGSKNKFLKLYSKAKVHDDHQAIKDISFMYADLK